MPSTGAKSMTVLMSRLAQRRSGVVMTLTPVTAFGLATRLMAWVKAMSVGFTFSFGKLKVRSAAPRVTCM